MRSTLTLPFLIWITSISFLSCKDSGYDNPNRPLNKHIFEEEEIELGLPSTWQVRDGSIYIQKDRKIAEIVTGTIDLNGKAITGNEFLERLKRKGPVIEAKNNSYAFPDNYIVLDLDSIKVRGDKWYIAQTESLFDGPKEYGTVYNNYFITFEDDKMIYLNFYTFNYFPLDRRFSKDILTTFRVR